jgi:hypothetical protein
MATPHSILEHPVKRRSLISAGVHAHDDHWSGHRLATPTGGTPRPVSLIASFSPMQKSSGFSIGNSAEPEWRFSAGFREVAKDGFSAWGRFVPFGVTGVAAPCNPAPEKADAHGMEGPIDLDALDDYLMSDHAPDDSMGLSDLDGFLTGIVVGPELILPSEWLPGGEKPVFQTEDEMRTVLGTIRHATTRSSLASIQTLTTSIRYS